MRLDDLSNAITFNDEELFNFFFSLVFSHSVQLFALRNRNDCIMEWTLEWALKCLSLKRNYRKLKIKKKLELASERKSKIKGWNKKKTITKSMIGYFVNATISHRIFWQDDGFQVCMTCKVIFMWRKDIINPMKTDCKRIASYRIENEIIKWVLTFIILFASFAFTQFEFMGTILMPSILMFLLFGYSCVRIDDVDGWWRWWWFKCIKPKTMR